MFTSGKSISAQDVRETSSVQREALGSVGVTRDGRQYVYGNVGGTAVTSGNLLVAEAIVANHTNRTVAASVAVGALEVTVNIGATAAAQDLYADGYLIANDAAGEGVAYQIQGHSAGAGSDVVRVRLYEPVTKALTVSVSEVSFIKHPAKDVVASTTLSKAVGVSNINQAIDAYGWFQNWGVASVLQDGNITKGVNAVQSNGTAGAVEIITDSTAGATDLQEVVGVALETTVSTENNAFFLKIG
jgi:hypothetical protein